MIGLPLRSVNRRGKKMLRFPLKEVWEAKRCKPEQLIVVERGMTPADCEYYERIGWDKYRAGDLIETKLPELGDGLYFSGKFSVHEPRGVVVEIKGKRYKVSFSEDYHYEPWKVQGKFVNFEPTDEPLSVPDRPAPDPYHRGWHYLKFFGQPHWIQSAVYPLDLRGNPCYHLMSIENGWGDSGNYNILIGFDENDVPNVAYFEASCC